MENKTEGFHYTYSAKEQEEVKRIRQKYQPREIDKMEQLRRLDAGVSRKATIVSLVLGIVGALILGSGMSLVMTSLGDYIGVSGALAMMLGVVIGVVGIVLVSCAYPVYNHMVAKERERIAPEILRLTEELLR